MVLEFTYTPEDLAEAQREHAAGAKTSQLMGFRFKPGLFGWVIFVGLAVMIFLLMQNNRIPQTAPPPAAATRPAGGGSLATILLPLVPWVIIFCVIWFIAYLQLRKTQAQNAQPRRSFLYEPGKEPNRGREPGALAAFMSALNNEKAIWESQPHLHRPQTMEVTEGGVVVSDAVSRTENRWDAYSHVRETPNLFLLYTSDLVIQSVPKRAFASEQDLRSFRELVRQTIAERPAPAFPVVPVASSPEQ